MATAAQPMFSVRRKPVSGHTYAAVAQQSIAAAEAIPVSPELQAGQKCGSIGEYRARISSVTENDAAALLFRTPDNTSAVHAAQQCTGQNATHESEVDGSLPQDPAKQDFHSMTPMYRQRSTKNDTWSPPWLHLAVLLAFCALFASLLVALTFLYYFAGHNNGISTQISSNHYYWTYGPTSILMVTIALWRQVDYTCRRLTPWMEFYCQQPDIKRSLLLDYVSPLLTTSLFRAMRYRHWAVMTSLTGFILLKLVTIFSTGLLVLSRTQLSHENVPLQTSSTFSTELDCLDSNPNCTQTYYSADPVLTYYGILKDNLPYPDGTTNISSFEMIELTDAILEGAVVTTTVTGLYPHFGCEVGVVHNNSGLPPREGFDSFESSFVFNPADAVSFMITTASSTYWIADPLISFCNPRIARCPPRVVTTWDLHSGWWDADHVPKDTDPYLLMVTDVRYKQTISPTLNKTALQEIEPAGYVTVNVTEWEAHVEKATAVICNPYYSLEDTSLRIDTAQMGTNRYIQADGPLTHTGNRIDGYANSNLSYDFMELMLNGIPEAFPDSTSQFGEADMFDLMSKLDAVANESDYLDGDVLNKVATTTFDMIIAQLASQRLQSPGQRNVTGTIGYYEDRLHIKELSFWVMAAGFTIMMGFSVLILATKPKVSLPRDPGPIANCACILASSPGLNGQLSTLGSASDATLNKKLSSRPFESTVSTADQTRRFSTSTSMADHKVQKRQTHPVTPSSKSWQPLPASIAFKIASAAALCMTITALACIQHVSDTKIGIADVKTSSMIVHSLSTYIPATFMLLVATLCSSAAFTIKTMSPYHHLSRGRARAAQTVLGNITGKMPILVIFTSLRRALPGPFFISIAAILSSFLTIVVSGLYTVSAVPLPRLIVVNQLDKFNASWDSTTTDNDAMSILNLLEHKNASYPRFTYGELAIPAIQIARDQESVSNALKHSADIELHLSLPVMRASLNCTLIPETDFAVVEWPYNKDSGCEYLHCGLGTPGTVPNATLEVQAGRSSYCHLPGLSDSPQSLNYSLQLAYQSENAYSGAIQGLPGCPSVAFMLGYFSLDTSLNYTHQDTTNKQNITTFVCSQYLEESVTDVHFKLPSLSLDTTHPPVFNESNSRLVSTEQYDIIGHLGQLSVYPNYWPWGDTVNTDMPIDTFMQLVLYGTDGIPANELIHPANAEKLIERVQHVYRKYMAQAINANMRQSFTSSGSNANSAGLIAPSNALNATMIDPTRMRVQQNKVSAIVLEVLLGLILLLGAAGYGTTRLRNTLPHNPSSIAGVMSLLAGSALCDHKTGILPDGAETMTERELEAVFQKWQFGLGWWDEGGALVVGGGKGEGGGLRFGIDVDSREGEKGGGD